ncbi:MAG: NDP-sugar synthase [Deltaproteobacteria bacterium]|nr:NDP-sugar synthase [Deltaproteobacteria bacterium]
MSAHRTKGFLLAAGFGTRLWPLSDVRAKPAFPFRGKALIAHVAAHMHAHGIRDFWVNTHHLPTSIDVALQPARALPGASFTLAHEPEILGTSGAIVNLRDALGDGEVLIMNAKVVTQIDLSAVMAAHRASEAPVTMVCVPNPKKERFTHVAFAKDGTLEGFVSGDKLGPVDKPYVFTGIQVLSPSFFDFLPPPGFSDTIKDVYPRIQSAGRRIHVFAANESWNEFSTLARYRDLHDGGFVDASATIGKGARTDGSVVWERAQIGDGAMLKGCIVADGTVVPPRTTLENVAIIDAARVKNLEKAATRLGPLLCAPVA